MPSHHHHRLDMTLLGCRALNPFCFEPYSLFLLTCAVLFSTTD